ncbi:Ff.00g086080.m01.CDS01 [Fusarium sp. VM40]|nr:Ff.00g086080.m01.CDS01 [Fusarium sp. VM40]
MSKPEGIIESTLDHIHMKQSTIRDKRLQSYILSGLKMINESVEAISQVKNDFAQWKATTETLVQVLKDKTSMIVSQRDKDTRKLESRSSERETQERKLHDRRIVLRELQDRCDSTVWGYTRMFNNPEATTPSLSTFFTSVLATLATPVMMFSLFGIWSMESTVTNFEAQIDELNRKLEFMQGEVTSLGEVLNLLEKTLIDLNTMQQEIENFMEFLIGIQKIIAIAKEGDDRVLTKDLKAEDLRNDTKLNMAYLKDASSMKDRFRIAAKAAGLYNEISDKFILPGLSWLGGLCFVDSSDETYEKSLLEIEDQENYLCDGAKQLITQASFLVLIVHLDTDCCGLEGRGTWYRTEGLKSEVLKVVYEGVLLPNWMTWARWKTSLIPVIQSETLKF